LFRGPELVEFRAGDPAFKISRDASRVQFSLAPGGARLARFALFARELLPGAATSGELVGANTASPHFVLADWKDSSSPSLNGVRLRLDDYEVARAYAIDPDEATLVLGTEWALRAYDRGAALRWKTEAPGVVRGLAVAPDGRAVVAALSDGTIRWYRMEDGVEFLALFAHAAGEEWIAWNPEGYYVSSNLGDNYVGWHLNRGRDRAADFYRAVQFERILYRPDLVDESFRRRGPTTEGARHRSPARFDVSQLAAIAPPRVRIDSVAPPRRTPDGGIQARLRISAERAALPMVEQAVFVNDIPVTQPAARSLAADDRNRFIREMTVNLALGENRVRVEVSTASSLGFAEIHVDATGAPSAAPAPGDLYLLAVGVSEFPGLKNADLAYAARDAEELARFFREQGTRSFRRIVARTISDLAHTKPYRTAIVDALDFAAEAGERDTVIVFLASHGLSDARGDYFFVPRDAQAGDVAAIAHGGGADAPSLIGWRVFFDALRGVAGRRILVVDTCQARDMEGRADLRSLGKRSAASRFALVLASKGREESQEYAPAQHGLFTYAFLEGLRGSGDADRDGLITLAEAFRFSLPIVERLRDKSIGPQTPQLVAPARLGEAILARRAASF
jgi:hypothetical protein